LHIFLSANKLLYGSGYHYRCNIIHQKTRIYIVQQILWKYRNRTLLAIVFWIHNTIGPRIQITVSSGQIVLQIKILWLVIWLEYYGLGDVMVRVLIYWH